MMDDGVYVATGHSRLYAMMDAVTTSRAASCVSLVSLCVGIAAIAAQDALSNDSSTYGLTNAKTKVNINEAIFTKDCQLSVAVDECSAMRDSMIAAFVFALNALILNVAQILNINAEAVMMPDFRTRAGGNAFALGIGVAIIVSQFISIVTTPQTHCNALLTPTPTLQVVAVEGPKDWASLHAPGLTMGTTVVLLIVASVLQVGVCALMIRLVVQDRLWERDDMQRNN